MMHKKAISNFIVILLITLVSFGIALPLYGTLLSKLGEESDTYQCKTSVILNSNTKTLGAEHYKINCPYDKETITMDVIDNNPEQARALIEKYNNLGDKYQYSKLNPKNKADLQIFRTNEFIANEMVECWDKMGEGKLHLFQEWYKLIPVKDKSSPASAWESWQRVGMAAGKQVLHKVTFDFVGEAEGFRPPTFCVICSRIGFDKEVRKTIWDQVVPNDQKSSVYPITSLYEWMARNPVKRVHGTGAVAEYLESANPGSYYRPEEYIYNIASPYYDQGYDKAVAVVFMEENIHAAQKLVLKPLRSIGLYPPGSGCTTNDCTYHRSYMGVIPMEEVKNYCDYIEN